MNKQQNTIVKEWQNNLWKVVAFGFMALLAVSAFLNFFEVNITPKQGEESSEEIINAVLPKAGVELPAAWNDLGEKLVEVGVIDRDKFESLYAQRGDLSEEVMRLLEMDNNGKIVISEENADIWLNLLWAFGLGNKNPILEEGPMVDPRYGGAGNFASTGGWTLSKGNTMDHYSKHRFLTLNESQQEIVEKVARNIYRPCCGNPTYFPDCNHGMAMLGLLQLMAARDVSEEEMYNVALKVNSYWFPQTYLTIAKYFENQGVKWSEVDPKLALGESFSSVAGYRRVLSEVEPVSFDGGGSC